MPAILTKMRSFNKENLMRNFGLLIEKTDPPSRTNGYSFEPTSTPLNHVGTISSAAANMSDLSGGTDVITS